MISNKTIRTLALAAGLVLQTMAGPQMLAANTVTQVDQVTGSVTVSGSTDYVITSKTPFSTTGSVNITDLDHSVVIIRDIKPSRVISGWLSHVYINGEKAVEGSNCQVKMYANGAIIFPYAKGFKPLTVYSDQNFGGTSVNDFGLENTGGFMNTLSDAKLNNKIRSFKLKRGYMVTFSTLPGGRGYSRCFIADKADLEIKTLPAVLDNHITSYRVFQWFNAKKAGIADNVNATACAAVNASWSYTWGTGQSLLPDVECVANHIYEDWPSASACGSVTYSCHMKTNNEPGNSADDHPQDVATVLANWENLMRTGMRLCSESSHDGSMGHLKAFIDSIDARGWRCDILDLHCYWPSGNFTQGNLEYYSNHYGNGRPIWISEWVWGASWNHNGFWGATDSPGSCSDANQTIVLNGTKPILQVLNSTARVERYAYWNSEAAGTHIYDNGSATKLGRYYAEMNEGLGYNAANEFVPRTPPQKNPSTLTGKYDVETQKMKLSWRDYNGEYNQSMVIECKPSGSNAWTTVMTVEQREAEAPYTQELDAAVGNKYRIKIVDLMGKERLSSEVMAINESLTFGDPVEVDGKTLYLGGNMLVNGDFSIGLADWTNGKDESLAAPYFQVLPIGGYNGSAYLQCYGSSTDAADVTSVRKLVNLKKNTYYYVAGASCNSTTSSANDQRIARAAKVTSLYRTCLSFVDGAKWNKQTANFNTGASDTLLIISLRNLGGKAMFDDFCVSELFETREEALANALECERQRVKAFKQAYSSSYDGEKLLDIVLENETDPAKLEESLQLLIEIRQMSDNSELELRSAVEVMEKYGYHGLDEIGAVIDKLLECMTYKEAYDLSNELISLKDTYLPYTLNTTAISSPSFENGVTTGWVTKAGTYTAGDQRTATISGKSCWNAWWNVSAAGGKGTTMDIHQVIPASKKLTHGLYAVECLATTQHYCAGTQNAYIVDAEGKVMESAKLKYDYQDIPTIAEKDHWQTLVTPYVYVEDNAELTIGFHGSKEGLTDGQWMKYGSPTSKGDNREGWWCATDFKLRYIPLYFRVADAAGWGTICLPYAFSVPAGVKIYKIAGVMADNSAVCLEEETEQIVAGRPYVFKAEPNQSVTFFESGTKRTIPATYSNLSGVLAGNAKYPVGGVMLSEGAWRFIGKAEDQTAVPFYSGYVRDAGQLPVLKAWEGATIPAIGMPAPTSVSAAYADGLSSKSAGYDAAGRRVKSSDKGLQIVRGRKIARK